MEVLMMVFSYSKRLFSVFCLLVGLGFAVASGYRWVHHSLYSSEYAFLQRHALHHETKHTFKSFFKQHNLDASFFRSDEKIIEQKLTGLGFTRTASGSNSLVMKCPETLGNFIIKAPGRFHNVTRAVVQAPLENVTRAVGADKLTRYLEKSNSTQVKAVDEYLFHIPGADKELHDYDYLIIEPYLVIDETKSFSDFTLNQFKQTVDSICAIDYSDTSSDNIVMDKEGMIYFLDVSERDYLAAYNNLPEDLYFSCSSSDDTDSLATNNLAITSYEEACAQSLADSQEPVHKEAACAINKKLEVIYHGLLPLGKENIDDPKRAYLQEKINELVDDIEIITKTFENETSSDLAKTHQVHLRDQVQLQPVQTSLTTQKFAMVGA